MTYTCTATRLKQTITECGLSEKERDSFLKKYKAVGFDTFYNVEGTKSYFTATEMLEFHKEFSLTTIEPTLVDVENFRERRQGNV